MSISATLLDAFVALEESLNFTRAAERCNVTQSSLSQMIRRLESTVGRRLFDRDTHAVRLTAEGAMFSERAHRILNEINEALAEMRDDAASRRGKLSLAANPSFVASWLPGIFEEFKRRYAGVSIELFDTNPERAFQLLKEKSVEIVICPEAGNSSWSVSRRLLREPFFLACQSTHGLAKKRLLQRADFAGLPVIYPMYTGSSALYSGGKVYALRNFLRILKARDTGIEVEHMPSVAALVGGGLGCALVPAMAAQMIVASSVTLVPVSQKLMLRELYVVQREKLGLSEVARSFLKITEDVFASTAS